jgi:hypothetical protein
VNRYVLHGLHLTCTIALPTARLEEHDGPADVTLVVSGQQPIPLTAPPGEPVQGAAFRGRPLYSTARQADGSHLLRIHGCVDFHISSDADRISAVVDPDCPDELLSLLVAGNLIAVISLLRGELVLHASAVEQAGRSVAFVAHSGVGKSTLAALCCRHGGRFVTDDVLRVDLSGGVAVAAHRGSAENRLRRGVDDLVGDARLVRRRKTVDGRTAWEPGRSLLDSTELAAVVLPQPVRDQSSLTLVELSPAQAVFALASTPRVLGWHGQEGQRRNLANVSQLVRQVPVFRATVPWGPPFPDHVARELMTLTTRGARA